MMRRIWITLVCGCVAVLFVTSACGSQQPYDSDGDGWSDIQEREAGTDPKNADTDGDGYWDPQDANPLDPNIPESTEKTLPPPTSKRCIESTAEDWIEENIANISRTIGILVSDFIDVPMSRSIIAGSIKKALESYLEWEIVEIEPSEDGMENTVRVRLTLPLRVDIPGIRQEHKIQVDYVLSIRECRVTDSRIDTDSFHME